MVAPADIALFDPIAPDGAGMALYRAVGRSLLESIEAGIHPPGSMLPSETALAAAFGVSMGTLRKAVDDLVARGLLVRRQGRGTFVATHTADRALLHFFALERSDGLREAPSVEVIGFGRVAADAESAIALGIAEGAPALQIEQRLALQATTVGHEVLVLPAALFKGMNEKALRENAGALYAWFESEFGVTVVRATERAAAVIAERRVRDALGLPAGTAVLRVRRQAFGLRDRPVEFRRSHFDTRHHDLVSTLPSGAPT